jgi:hypothetical protein
VSDMLKIYVGTEPMQRIACAVLRYSMTRRTSVPLEFFEMQDLNLGLESQMFTGFSIYRYHVPFLAGYTGRAISMDADIVCQADIAELYNLPMTSGAMARVKTGYATSVMLLDCEKLKHWNVAEWAPRLKNRNIYQKTMWGRPGGLSTPDFTPLDPMWNQLDDFPAGTKQIHYTNIARQPWKNPGHPHACVFLKELKHAIENGAITKEVVLEEEGKQHVYAGLLKDALAS